MAEEVSVQSAAVVLGIEPNAVRKRIAEGSLQAVKRGRDWWLDAGEVERLHRQAVRAGRPLSASMAWAVLLLASGDAAAAERIAQHERAWARARGWLDGHSLVADAASVRRRARRERFELHSSEVARLRARDDVLETGISAGEVVGLVGEVRGTEVYAAVGARDAVIAEHALDRGVGSVVIRWVEDDLWPLIPSEDGRAPRAAVLVDLLESDDPRARREAAKALGA